MMGGGSPGKWPAQGCGPHASHKKPPSLREVARRSRDGGSFSRVVLRGELPQRLGGTGRRGRRPLRGNSLSHRLRRRQLPQRGSLGVWLSRFSCQGSASEKRSWSIRCPPKPPLKPIACGEVIPAPPIIQARPRPSRPYFFYSFGPCTARFLVFFWKKIWGPRRNPA